MENRRPRIYFSKSRAGNFDDILKVKNYLAKYDCEIIEFTGGTYTPEKLDSADFLLILPPELDKYEFVGRGQYEEFVRALNDTRKLELPIIITAIVDGIPYGVPCDDSYIIDRNWITDYGRFVSIDKDEELPIDDGFGLNYKNYGKSKFKSSGDFYPDLEDNKESNWIDQLDYSLSKISQDTKLTPLPTLPIVIRQLTYEEVFNSLNLL